MGLASALNTALTGLTAAETTIDVVGNNLANSNTVGFKASEATFATQFLQTQSLGSSATEEGGSAGTNPRQIGLGTTVAEIRPVFNQGTIEISSNPTDLAIQGDGFFIVEGANGEQLYTRNGIFKMNSESQLITITGHRLLGYTVDEQFDIQVGTLSPLEIRLGAEEVAKATEHVYLEGTLSPNGDVATAAEILQTGSLGDAAYKAADGSGVTFASDVAAGTAVATSGVGGGSMAEGDYHYKIVFYNDNIDSTVDSEGVPSTAIDATVGAGEDQVVLSGLPADASGIYTHHRIYRTTIADPNTYYLVGQQAFGAGDFTDTRSDADIVADGNQLNEALLDFNYGYYITFVDDAGIESRPTELLSYEVVDGRVQISDLPVPAAGDHPTDGWVKRRIYRNLSTSANSYHLVTEINDATTVGLTYTDGASDASIEGNPAIDLDGPKIGTGTLLTNVLSRDGSSYESTFEEGTLEFSGKKGGRSLSSKEFEITDTSTVLDLIDFMVAALGIQESPGPDTLNPIPPSTTLSGVDVEPGGYVTSDGQIRLVANNGTGNAIDIGLSALQLTTADGQQSVNIPFSSLQSAVGEGAVADFIAYDSLGIPISVRLTAVLESRTGSSTTYRWFADSPDNTPTTGVDIAVGTGLITFDGEGNFSAATESTVSIDRTDVASDSPMEFTLDFSQLSGLAADKSTMAIVRQDGSSPGVLTSFIVGEDGLIRGVFSNGITRDLGQIRLARFSNAAGLEQRGQNMFARGVNSGEPVDGDPGEQGIGTIIAGAVELSNTDVGSNLVDLILASTMYRGNTRVISIAQEMLDELLLLRR